MHRRLLAATLSLALLALLSFGDVLAQKDPNNKKGAVPLDSDTLTANDYTGVLKTTFNSDRSFTMTVETKTMVPIRGKGTGVRPPIVPGTGPAIANLNNSINNVYNAQAAYLKALAATQKPAGGKKGAKGASAAAQRRLQTTAQNLQNALVNYQNAAAVAGIVGAQNLAMGTNGVPNFRFDVKKQDYDFQHIETVKVRIMELPEQFDEKGNVKQYTEQEKKELKGKDKNLPGYEAQPDKLEVGQRVRVTLITVPKKKAADNAKDKEADKDKEANKDADKDKEKDADKDGEKKMQVKLVVILEQPDGTKNKKKQKDQ